MQRPTAVLTAAAVAVGGALAGFYAYHLWQSGEAPASQLVPVTAVAAPGTSEPEAPAADNPAQTPTHRPVPEQVPDITLPDIAGHPQALRAYLGHPLIINFWATWCAPCRREIPLLQQLRRSHQADGLEVVGVAVDFRAAVAQYVAHTPLSYPVLIGEDQGMMAAEKFGMDPVLPFSVFATGDGRIVAVKIGELHRDEADFILATMQSVVQGRLTLGLARSQIADRLHQLAVARVQGNATEPPPQ